MLLTLETEGSVVCLHPFLSCPRGYRWCPWHTHQTVASTRTYTSCYYHPLSSPSSLRSQATIHYKHLGQFIKSGWSTTEQLTVLFILIGRHQITWPYVQCSLSILIWADQLTVLPILIGQDQITWQYYPFWSVEIGLPDHISRTVHPSDWSRVDHRNTFSPF